jgi:hypothetical protein
LLQVATKICEVVNGEKYGEVLKTAPLSNKTVMRPTESVSEDIKEQLQTSIKRSPQFALQIDQSTDVAGLALLLAFIRLSLEDIAQEELCTAFSEMCKEWYIHGNEGLLHNGRYFLGKQRHRLYRRSSGFSGPQEGAFELKCGKLIPT